MNIFPSSRGGKTLQGTHDISSSWAAGWGCPDCRHSNGAGERGLAPLVRAAPPPTVRWPLEAPKCAVLSPTPPAPGLLLSSRTTGRQLSSGLHWASSLWLDLVRFSRQGWWAATVPSSVPLASLGRKTANAFSLGALVSACHHLSPHPSCPSGFPEEKTSPRESTDLCEPLSCSGAPLLHPDHPLKPDWHCLSSGTLRCHGAPASQQD